MDHPVLLVGFNRPESSRSVIHALRPNRPPIILFAVDGPRGWQPGEAQRVQAVQDLVSEIDWGAHVVTRFRDHNIGLRQAVTDAVTWAIGTFGSVIVLEDDVVPGRNFLKYMNDALNRFAHDERIGHVSGYNLVPPSQLTGGTRQSRLSRYPESCAWATWERSWKFYDDDLNWAMNARLDELKSITGSWAGALRWKQNFLDAQSGRIDSWAYRWINTIWSRNQFAVSPNSNLVHYNGHSNGTHTRRKPRYQELPPESEDVLTSEVPEHDSKADNWVGQVIFEESPLGVIRGVAISEILRVERQFKLRKQKKAPRPQGTETS
jgi:hypothetical protein